MCTKWCLILCLQVSLTLSAPMMQLLPLGLGMQSQMPFLRRAEPMSMDAPVIMYPQQPLMILLPQSDIEINDRNINVNEHGETESKEDLKSDAGYIDEDAESVIVDAKSKTVLPKNAIILLPKQGRLGIGDIISYIPFLPIEINVPDTISWIINAIGSLGNRFRPQQTSTVSNIKRFSSKGPMMPILLMPLDRLMLSQTE